MRTARDENRRGIALLPVVGLLAVLMLLAATAALLSRVELHASRNYESRASTEFLRDAVRKYAIQILHDDIYGADGVPYNYKVLYDVLGGAPGDGLYPANASVNNIPGDNEAFDSLHEEWVGCGQTVGPDWRLFRADEVVVDGVTLWRPVWLDGSVALGRDTLLAGRLKGQFWLHFWGFDAMGLDVNATGNLHGLEEDGWHAQCQGLTPCEINLALAIQDVLTRDGLPGDASAAAAALSVVSFVSGRCGLDGGPGIISVDDANLWGGVPLDVDLDGVLETGPTTDEPTEFDADWPVVGSDDWPFGLENLCSAMAGAFLGRDEASRVTGILSGYTGLPPDRYGLFNSRSASTITAGRSIRGGAFDATNPTPAGLGAYGFMDYGEPLVSPTTEKPIYFRRALYEGMGGLTPEELYAFISALGPSVLDSGGSAFGSTTEEVVLRQVAVNLIDMVDTDSNVTVWNEGGRTYYGVEPVPAIAEVEAAVRTRQHPYEPSPNGLVVGAGNPRSWGDLPYTGWGKYIKLVNPWNEAITLTGNYRLIVEGGMCWTYDPPGDPDGDGNADDDFDGIPDEGWGTPRTLASAPAVPDVYAVALTGSIPARGHFVIVDSETNPAGADVFGNLPAAANYMADSRLTYMWESETTLTLQQDQGPPGSPDWVTILVVDLADGATGETDADNAQNRDSIQSTDPRPCWVRGGVLQSKPWGPDAWVSNDNVTAEWNNPGKVWQWPDADTTHAGWFNRNWRTGGQPTAVGSGDNWFLSSAKEDEPYNNVYFSAPGEIENGDNLLHSFPPVGPDSAADMAVYSGALGQEVRVMNIGLLPTPGYVGFCHAGIDWCTLSLGMPAGDPPDPADFGAVELVYLRNFADYLVAPSSPWEDGLDNDGDGAIDAEDTGLQAGDRGGPEIRRRGKVNVNFLTLTSEGMEARHKLLAAFSHPVLRHMWSDAPARVDDLVIAIYGTGDTAGGGSPFSSVDDFFERVPELLEVDKNKNKKHPNSFRREALVRFMGNMVTVRSNVWGVFAAVRVGQDADGDGLESEEVTDERYYTIILDRSYDPVRVLLTTEVPKPSWLAD